MKTTRSIRMMAGAGLLLAAWSPTVPAQRQMEALGRGVVALPRGDGRVFVGWRLLGTDPGDVAFNVYRASAGAPAVKLNAEPIRDATHLVDPAAT